MESGNEVRQAAKELQDEEKEVREEAGRRPEAVMEAAFRGLYQQGEALKRLLPNFDLAREMRCPIFARLVHPAVGLDVQTAFQAAHWQELQPLIMAAAMRRSADKVLQAVAGGLIRPSENGARQEAVQIQEDPRSWSPQQKAQLRERVRRGERVSF